MSRSDDDYVLGRDIDASNRLNLQHFLWTKYFGYLIHPDIPRTAEMKVADVGTGTGAWLLDVAEELPPTAELQGFDIDISQAPATGFLPANVTMTPLDIFKPLPKDLESKFDVINLKLFMLVVKDNDPSAVVKNLTRMLKPGGWLQWSEADLIRVSHKNAAPGLSNTAMDRMRALTIASGPSQTQLAHWVPKLGESFESEGLVNVRRHEILGDDMPSRWQSYTNETTLAIYPEIFSRLPLGERKEELYALYREAVKEHRAGATWTAPRLYWFGQKPNAA